MVITHFVLAGRGSTGAMMGGVSVAVVVAADTCVGVSVTVATGLASVVWIWALLARAVLSFSLICSISSWSSWSSPGLGGSIATGGGATAAGGGAAECGWVEEEVDDDAEGKESTKLANEAGGPPFSHSLLFDASGLAGPSDLAPPTLVSVLAIRARSRRVLRVSRLKWTRLKSRASLMEVEAASAVSFLLSLFHTADAPGAGGAGGPGGT